MATFGAHLHRSVNSTREYECAVHQYDRESRTLGEDPSPPPKPPPRAARPRDFEHSRAERSHHRRRKNSDTRRIIHHRRNCAGNASATRKHYAA